MSDTYIAEICQVVRLLATSGDLLAKQGHFERLILVLLGLHRVLEVNLLDDLSEEIAVEVFAEAECEL